MFLNISSKCEITWYRFASIEKISLRKHRFRTIGQCIMILVTCIIFRLRKYFRVTRALSASSFLEIRCVGKITLITPDNLPRRIQICSRRDSGASFVNTHGKRFVPVQKSSKQDSFHRNSVWKSIRNSAKHSDDRGLTIIRVLHTNQGFPKPRKMCRWKR